MNPNQTESNSDLDVPITDVTARISCFMYVWQTRKSGRKADNKAQGTLSVKEDCASSVIL